MTPVVEIAQVTDPSELAFGESFGHGPPSMLWPTYIVRIDGEPAGWFELVPTRVIYPAVKPGQSKRKMLGCLRAIADSISVFFSGEQIKCVVPKESAFTDSIMAKFGFAREDVAHYIHHHGLTGKS